MLKPKRVGGHWPCWPVRQHALDGVRPGPILPFAAHPLPSMLGLPLRADLGSFADAAHAYEQAGDPAAAVRVLLQRHGDAESAADLAQRTGSAEASLAVARFCELGGKNQLAVLQYCLGGDLAAAFALAQRTGCVPALADWARQANNSEAALLAAGHFEAAGQLAAAAELCVHAGKHERAAQLYVQAGGESLQAAIKLATQSGDPAAATVVIEHLQVRSVEI